MTGRRWHKALKFLNFRTLRNTPAVVWRELTENEAVAIVANGETRAIMIGVEGGDAEEAVDLVRGIRAQRALSRVRAAAAASGAASLSPADIETEVRGARARRRAGQ